jgi:hypothetical protein
MGNTQKWRKSTYSGNSGNCVEVCAESGRLSIRDSKSPDRGRLHLSAAQWAQLRQRLAR